MNKVSARALMSDLKKLANKDKAQILSRFFKTGKGEYGAGDCFLGVTVPQQRAVLKKYYKELALLDLEPLITSKYHEYRLTALIILVEKYKRATDLEKLEIYNFYWHYIKFVNNWDLVDLSAPTIVGGFLLKQTNTKTLLRAWLRSRDLWTRRVAVLSTFSFIRSGHSWATILAAKTLLHDSQDLIHKAVGWMLREMGKRLGEGNLIVFLNENAKQMPRVMLRYAIEKLPENQRKFYLSLR